MRPMRSIERISIAFLLLGASIAAAVISPVLEAQEVDSRWRAWTGCWDPVTETDDTSLLCIKPVAGGVELFSVTDGEVMSREILRADGSEASSKEDGCARTRSAEFAADGNRLFISGDLDCGEVRQSTYWVREAAQGEIRYE